MTKLLILTERSAWLQQLYKGEYFSLFGMGKLVKFSRVYGLLVIHSLTQSHTHAVNEELVVDE